MFDEGYVSVNELSIANDPRYVPYGTKLKQINRALFHAKHVLCLDIKHHYHMRIKGIE